MSQNWVESPYINVNQRSDYSDTLHNCKHMHLFQWFMNLREGKLLCRHHKEVMTVYVLSQQETTTIIGDN
jgi:hypothetical protein